ncbi:MAG: SRPBCC family protein [Thermoleophilia bacterium]|nr:SRPBCC family protein [Thermoleophilia bacterium]
MSQVEESIEVEVPVSTAYNQWTQFEEFPKFMDTVDEIRQLDDTRLHWVVSAGGRTEEFDAVITEQIPDTRIAWKSTDGPTHAGVVDFHRLSDDKTQVMVIMDTETEGLVEKAAEAVGLVKRQVRGDLERFKKMIESRGEETGAWRGEVPRD